MKQHEKKRNEKGDAGLFAVDGLLKHGTRFLLLLLLLFFSCCCCSRRTLFGRKGTSFMSFTRFFCHFCFIGYRVSSDVARLPLTFVLLLFFLFFFGLSALCVFVSIWWSILWVSLGFSSAYVFVLVRHTHSKEKKRKRMVSPIGQLLYRLLLSLLFSNFVSLLF